MTRSRLGNSHTLYFATVSSIGAFPRIWQNTGSCMNGRERSKTPLCNTGWPLESVPLAVRIVIRALVRMRSTIHRGQTFWHAAKRAISRVAGILDQLFRILKPRILSKKKRFNCHLGAACYCRAQLHKVTVERNALARDGYIKVNQDQHIGVCKSHFFHRPHASHHFPQIRLMSQLLGRYWGHSVSA